MMPVLLINMQRGGGGGEDEFKILNLETWQQNLTE